MYSLYKTEAMIPEMDDANELLRMLATLLQRRQWKLATAESCTGGGLAALLTSRAGSSAWFECGFVTYSNASKSCMLAVPETLIEHDGAVSEAVVVAMVKGVLAHSHADIAVAISGIAGPGGAVADKPVGTVCLAWGCTGQTPVKQRFLFAGNREAVRQQAIIEALKGLLRCLHEG